MNDHRFLYLIQGSPRAQLADVILEYRTYAAEHPDDELSASLLRVSREVRIALREKRRIMRATGEPGKVNERIPISEEQRAELWSTRRARLAAKAETT